MNYLVLVSILLAIPFFIYYLYIFLKTRLAEDRDKLLLSIVFPVILSVIFWQLGSQSIYDTPIKPPQSSKQDSELSTKKRDNKEHEICHEKTIDKLPVSCLFREKTL